MTREEFKAKYNLKFNDAVEEVVFFTVLDDLYLQYTKEQVLNIMGDFYDHADDIFNDIKKTVEEGMKKLEELVEEALDKPGEA